MNTIINWNGKGRYVLSRAGEYDETRYPAEISKISSWEQFRGEQCDSIREIIYKFRLTRYEVMNWKAIR